MNTPHTVAQSAEIAVTSSPGARRRIVAFGLASRNWALSIVDQAVVSGVSFATSVLIGRQCSQEDLGVYGLALSLVLLARGIQRELVSTPYSVHSHRREGKALAAFTGSTFIHQGAISFLLMCGLAGLLVALSLGWGPEGLSPVVWVLLGLAPFILLREHVRQLTFARLRVPTALALDGAVAVLQLGGLLILAWSGQLTVGRAYLLMGIACGAACTGWFAAGGMAFRVNLGQAWSDWKCNWRFGRWALSSHALSMAMAYAVPWVLALTLSTAATGLMAACTTIVNLLGMFATGISNYLTPRAASAFATGGMPALRRVLGGALAIYLISVGSFCLFLLATGDLLAVVLYGERYAGSGSIMILLALQLLLNTVGITAGNGLWALDRPRLNFPADIASLVVAMPLLVFLAGTLGVLGAALALLVGTTIGTAVRCFIFLRSMRVAVRH